MKGPNRPPTSKECPPGSVERMAARGFGFSKSECRFLRANGIDPSRQIQFTDGTWLAEAWTPYAHPSRGWTGEPFDSLEACYVAAELENWGGL